MTEAEWLTCIDPMPMLEFLRENGTDRKLRLFACACCRLKWESLTDQASRTAVTVTEQFADGTVTQKALKKARRAAFTQWRFPKLLAAWHAADLWAWQGACAAAESAAERIGPTRDAHGMANQCCLLRDICGNPFRPVSGDLSWITSDVNALATGIYDERAVERMPILADALQDAGCENEDILNHCQLPCKHVRGCWVVDLVLGKQ